MEPEPDLCVEIRRPLKNTANDNFSSGYAFGSDLILTCSHGLYDDNIENNSDINISWRNLEEDSIDTESKQTAKIIWVNKNLDIAVIHCECPHKEKLIPAKQIISTLRPEYNETWESGGYLAKMKDINDKQKFMNPKGILQKEHDKTSFFELWGLEKIVVESKLWEGFSGSPVFVNNKIVGVIKTASPGTGGANLTATLIPSIFDAEDDNGAGTFAKAVGLDLSRLNERVQRQTRQFEKMCQAIDEQIEIFKAFNDQFKIIIKAESSLNEPKTIVEKFNELNDEQAVQCITVIFKGFCKSRKEIQAQSIGGFIEAWWPVLFEHDGQLEAFREQLNNNNCAVVECPASLATTTELMMAEAEERMVKLELTARNVLGSPNDLGSFAETGLNEDGSEEQRQLDDLLSTRFLSADNLNIFENYIHTVVNIIGSNEDALGELKGNHDKEKHQVKLANILKAHLNEYEWRFYFRFNVDENFERTKIDTIKQRYPSLAFLISVCNDSQEEAERYRRLMQIVTATKSKENLIRELDKYA